MTYKIKEKILTIDVVSDNNRVYPREEIEKAVKKFNEKHETIGCLCDNNELMGTDISKVTHTLDCLKLIDGDVYADITILDTPLGKSIQSVFNGTNIKPKLISLGTGILSVKDPSIVSDFSFVGVQILPDIEPVIPSNENLTNK